ncbi:Bicarbonate transport system permease protein CmpB [subsurface metagenome]
MIYIFLSGVVSLGIGFIAWIIISNTIMPLVPTPFEVGEILIPVLIDPWFFKSVFVTSYRILAGVMLGAIFGMPLGLLMGWQKKFDDLTFPIFELLRPVPPVAWIPLSIIVLGNLNASMVFICFIGAFFVITLNAKLGVEKVPLSFYRAAKSLGANPSYIFRKIVLPAALPDVFTGFTLGVGISSVSVVAAEMIAGNMGIGYLCWESFSLLRFPDIVIAMLTIGLIGWFYSTIVRLIGSKFLKWTRIISQ